VARDTGLRKTLVAHVAKSASCKEHGLTMVAASHSAGGAEGHGMVTLQVGGRPDEEVVHRSGGPERRARQRMVPHGDEWVRNGQKRYWDDCGLT